MNCKVGDIALVMNPRIAENLGALVEIVGVWPKGNNVWCVRSLSGPRRRQDGVVSEVAAAPDATLQPIRHPNRTLAAGGGDGSAKPKRRAYQPQMDLFADKR